MLDWPTSGRILTALAVAALCSPASAPASPVESRSMLGGQVRLEGIPPLDAGLAERLRPYQSVRQARFLDWLDDDTLLIRTRLSGTDQLHRVDGPLGARQQLTFRQEPVRHAEARPGGEVIAFTGDRGGNESDQVHLLDLAEGTVRRVTDGRGRNRAVVWSHDGRRLAYQSTRRDGTATDLWAVDFDGERIGEPYLLLTAPDDTSWWLPLDFSDDGERLLVQQYRSVTDSRIYEFDLVSDRLRPVTGDGTSSNAAARYDRRGDGIFFITNQGGGAADLAWLSLEDGAEIEILTGVLNWDVNQFSLSPDRRRGAFVVNEAGVSRLYLFSPRDHHYNPVPALPPGVVGPMGFSPNGRQLALTLTTSRTPGDVFVLELSRRTTEARALRRWTRSEMGGLEPASLPLPERISYPTFDRVGEEARRIPAFLYRPQGNGPFPVVIWIHGGPEAQFRPGFNDDIAAWTRELGVAVIAPNVRGSLGYGSRYASLDNGRLREDAVRDIGALLDWIRTDADLDHERVAVYGASYGGYMALATAVHHGDRLRAVVDRVGISHFPSFLTGTQDYRRAIRREEYGDERDPEMRAFLESISPLNRADEIRTPLLVAQGRNDPRVPWQQSRTLVDAVRAAGQPVWYMEALNEGHGYRRRNNQDLWQQIVVAFLERYLLAEDAPSG